MIDNIVLSGDNPGGLNELKDALTPMTIFPQPAMESFDLQINNLEIPREYSIFNLDGREVLSGKADLNKSIFVNELKPGYYLLKVVTKSGLVYFHSLVVG